MLILYQNDDKLIIDQTSTKNTSDVLIQALETNDAELFKSVFSEQTLKLQPDIDEGIKYIFNIFEGDNLEIVYENQSSESFSDLQAKCVWSICVIKTTEKCYSLTWTEWVQQETDPSAQGVYSLIFEECEEDQRGAGGGDLSISAKRTKTTVNTVVFFCIHDFYTIVFNIFTARSSSRG